MEQSTGPTLISPQEIMQENLVFLREYARLLLVEEDETLAPVEDFKDVLMQEYLAMGTYFKVDRTRHDASALQRHFEPRYSPELVR